jgi:hypothetical protein
MEFVGEIMSRRHLFWNAGVLAASETGGAARLNVRQVVDGSWKVSVLLSSVFRLLIPPQMVCPRAGMIVLLTHGRCFKRWDVRECIPET